ncbi:hypothetical protein HPG69_011606 [Diceros bicornis minor]|uniref:Uncharacterized protein n=1 Tax=Diceros bicornis minor TaxID=77932 RepID=A0A7J7EHH8_DICBM|nr:hypothetical protein HPG69_011606 [Diceros bicornis minor]
MQAMWYKNTPYGAGRWQRKSKCPEEMMKVEHSRIKILPFNWIFRCNFERTKLEVWDRKSFEETKDFQHGITKVVERRQPGQPEPGVLWKQWSFDGDDFDDVEEDEGLDDLEKAEEEGQENVEILPSGE